MGSVPSFEGHSNGGLSWTEAGLPSPGAVSIIPRGTVPVANFKVNPNVVAQRVDDQIVLVNLETNRIFALNSTGARLWELLSDGRSAGEIHAELSKEYAVDEAGLKEEIERLLGELNAESLVAASDDD